MKSTDKWLTHFILAAARANGRAVHVDGPSPVYSDEHIAHCARLYQDNPVIREKGVLFVTFLAYPEEVMRALAGGTAMPLPEDEAYYQLLPAQRAIQAQLDEEALDRDVRAQIRDLERLLDQRRMRVSNGAAIEPMHHKSWPRHRNERLAVDAYGVPLGEEAGAL